MQAQPWKHSEFKDCSYEQGINKTLFHKLFRGSNPRWSQFNLSPHHSSFHIPWIFLLLIRQRVPYAVIMNFVKRVSISLFPSSSASRCLSISGSCSDGGINRLFSQGDSQIGVKPAGLENRTQQNPKNTLEYLRCPILKVPLTVVCLAEGEFLEATKGDIKIRYPYPQAQPGSTTRYIKLRSIDASVVK